MTSTQPPRRSRIIAVLVAFGTVGEFLFGGPFASDARTFVVTTFDGVVSQPSALSHGSGSKDRHHQSKPPFNHTPSTPSKPSVTPTSAPSTTPRQSPVPGSVPTTSAPSRPQTVVQPDAPVQQVVTRVKAATPKIHHVGSGSGGTNSHVKISSKDTVSNTSSNSSSCTSTTSTTPSSAPGAATASCSASGSSSGSASGGSSITVDAGGD